MQFQREFTSRSCYHMLESWLASYMLPTRDTITGCNLDQVVCIGRRGEWTAYLSEASVRQAGEFGLAFLADPVAVQRHIAGSVQAGESCLLSCRDINAHRVGQATDEELVSYLEQFFAAYSLLQAYYQISGTSFMALASARVLETLDAPIEKQSQIFSLITIGDQRVLKTFQEKQDWLTLLLEAKGRELAGSQLDALLQEHDRMYAYIGAGSDNLGGDTLAQLHARLAQDAQLNLAELRQRLEELKHNRDLLQERREQALTTLKLSPAERLLVDGLATIGVHRLQLREVFTTATHQSYCLFQHLFRRYQEQVGPLDEDLLRQISVQEAFTLARGEKLDRSCVAERFAHGFCTVQQGVHLAASGDEALQWSNALFPSSPLKRQRNDEVKGTVGNTGPVARGRALVLPPGLSRGEQIRLCNSTMRKGDILVTGMTYPSLVPACEIAGALVTDFGGVTCHAVIIAREFDIPCIVGTDYITQVVQTGDLIEVDTSMECIRILSRGQAASWSSS